jgi:molecular chaperone GrpE (heat shock protein)
VTDDSTKSVIHEIKALREDFNQKIAADSTQQKAFDQLYSELQQYKEDFAFKNEKPILLDLLLFYDSLNWFQESLVKQEMSPDVLEENFQYLIDELLELLYRRNVTPMESAERFERESHRAVQVVQTDNEAHHELITQVMKRGFRRGETTLRPEEVVVARHKGKR